jgi:hypothetical protein
MAKTVLAGLYIVKQDENGNVMIFLPQPDGTKDEKTIVIYDGKEHALFSRNSEQNIILDYVNPEVREILNDTDELYIVEVEDQDIKDSYKAGVRHVEEIPLKWEEYGLSTWDRVRKKE